MTMPFLQTFDSAVCDATRDRRQASVTPLQALAMYNGRFANEEATHLAARIRKEAGESTATQIQLAFKTALGREPTSDESERMQALMATSTAGSDEHATLLNLLGLDDENLTYHYAGRIRRLTDIRGNVLKQIIA